MSRNRNKNALAFVVLFTTLALSISVGCASAATHYVNPGESIQAAVNAADLGDTIIVRDGTYTENVDVNKRLTIQSENGSANCIVPAANSNDHVFDVSVDYVNISGFTVAGATGGGGDYKAGIYFSSADHCIISDNNASSNNFGIYLTGSTNNNLTNITTSNNGYGILLYYSDYNKLTDITASNNTNYGIYLIGSTNNNLTNNTANSNNDTGIYLNNDLWSSSNYNTLTNNTANSNNGIGIYIDGSDSNNLTNNTANSNNDTGIYIDYSSNNNLTNNTMSGNTYNFGVHGLSLLDYTHDIDTSNLVDEKPIYYWVDQQDQQVPDDAGFVGIVNSKNIVVNDLTLAKNRYGVLFAYTENSSIENVAASNNTNYGICLVKSDNNDLTKITASDNVYGILLYKSDDNELANNNASNNGDGIYLQSSSNNKLTNNTMSGNTYNFGVGGVLHVSLLEYTHEIDTSNLVDGKPIYYWVDQQDQQVPDDAGFVGIVNSKNIVVKDLTLTKNRHGVLFAYTEKSSIENVTVSNNSDGIYFDGWSDDNELTNIIANSNNHHGIFHYCLSSNNKLTNITTSNNGLGILLDYSDYNKLTDITASNNTNYGIYLSGSIYNKLTNIIANSNNHHGIYLRHSDGSELTKITANSNNDYGIYLVGSDDCELTNITANSNSDTGIYLDCSDDSELTNITANSNNNGIWLKSSSNNLIYNNYFNNTHNAYDNRNNIWNISKTEGTNIINGPYLGGNYWGDYAGEDLDGDGLGDTMFPYNSSGNITNGGDYLPLVKPAPSIFDTGPGTYPSIMGTHEGAITPNQTITVSTLYTYPCAGTGGHTEYAKIRNKTWDGVVAHF